MDIKVLGGWRARRGGEEVIKGENMQPVLHALILGEGRLTREDLRSLLPNVRTYQDEGEQALSDSLTALRVSYGLEITRARRPALEPEQPRASIDLFDFFALTENGDYAEAWKLIDKGQVPATPSGPDEYWNDSLKRFERCRWDVRRARDADRQRGRSMKATRERLLDRTLVAGVGPDKQIGEIREQLDSLAFAWRAVRPAAPAQGSLPDYLRERLIEDTPAPRRVVLVGAPGSGKALTAISTFLRLTDVLEHRPGPAELRTVLFVDARSEGGEPGFGGKEWLEQRLAAAGHESGDGRPIIIVPHADAFLARSGRNPREALALPLFANADVMLCCNELYYEKALRFTGYATHEVRLLPWDHDQQRTFAGALYDEDIVKALEEWRRAEDAREVLCRVPLHLAWVLSLLDLARRRGDEHGIEQVFKRSQLLESVARMRIQVQGADESEIDGMMDELAAIAHRFNRASSPADVAITFPSLELREHLQSVGDDEVDARYDALTRKTLLGAPAEGREELRFEDALWGWFFTALYIVRTVQCGGSPTSVLGVFSRLYWPNVMELCKELLRDRLRLHDEMIVTALRDALEAPEAPGVSTARRRIAREQIAYLLAVLANPGMQEQLAGYFNPVSGAYEADPLVRRALAFGMANAGASKIADCYAEELRREREQPQPRPTADTNVGFLLSYRGDQAFDVEHPERIEPGVEPKRLIAQLAKGLVDERHRGSWRLKLATLIDLADAERIDPELFTRAVAPHREELVQVINRLGGRKVEGRWPEIGELREILEVVVH